MNKKLIGLLLLYVLLYSPAFTTVTFGFALLLLIIILIGIAIFTSISVLSQYLFKKKKAYFYPFILYIIIDVFLYIYGTVISPDEFGLGMLFSFLIIAATVAIVPFYFVLNPKFLTK